MEQKPFKISLLGAGFCAGNGVAALTAGAIRSIIHGKPDAQISLLEYAKEGGQVHFTGNRRTIPIDIVDIRFSKKFYLRNNIARLIATSLLLKFLPSSMRGNIVRRNPWLQHVDETDLLASIAGGDSFSDIYGLPRFFYVSLPQLLAIWMGKRLVLLPQTIGPFRTGLARTIARYILARAETVYSRDRQGLESAAELLGSKGVEKKVRFCYDVAFVMEPDTQVRADLKGLLALKADGECRVGLNVSGLLSMGGYSRQNMFGLRCDYDDLTRGLIKLLLERDKVTVLLVPHVFGSGSECDSPVCERLYAELKDQYKDRLGLVVGDYNCREIKSVIGQCDFFIGARMHACIAAVSQSIPTVCIAYSDKFSGVMETLGVEELVSDARKLNECEILKIVDQTFERRHAIRQHLEQKLPQVTRRVFSLFDDTQIEGGPDADASVAEVVTD